MIIFYGLPAYGHTLSNLYLVGRLARAGVRVVYYSAEPFREVIEENGCEYRAYPMDWGSLDLTDGERILKLYRLVLEYTWRMLPELLEQAKKEGPRAVIFDSLALWGRAVGQLCSLPSFAFYSIAAIDWTWGFPISPWGKGLGAYVPGFSSGFLRYAEEIPRAARYAKRLRDRYGMEHLGLLPVLMNRGDYNLCGYSRLFQPGGQGFGREYRFVGPLSVHRRITGHNDFSCSDNASSALAKPLIYISLGTVFNQNEAFLRTVMEQLGASPVKLPTGDPADRKEACPGHRSGEGFLGSAFRVVLVWSGGETVVFPENFTVRPFVNQNEVLKHASLFITAGGVNSLHEALYFGVPCLMCPQQGEQRLNARRFERLGFGRILRNPKSLRQEAQRCMELKGHWDEMRRKQMTAVSLGKVLELFETCGVEGDR